MKFIKQLFADKSLLNDAIQRQQPDCDLVLHIGAPKAGSSALQKFLSVNQDVLLEHGFYYPSHGLDPNGISGGHSNIGKHVAAGEQAEARALLKTFKKEAAAAGGVLLLSAEAFFGHPRNMQAILDGSRPKIIAFFRDPLEAVLSNYNQLVKRHFGTRDFGHYCRAVVASGAKQLTGEVFDEWADCFGSDQLTVIDYALTTSAPIEWVFLDAIGLLSAKKRFTPLDGRVNGSYTVSALELKRLLNHVLERNPSRINATIDWLLQEYSDKSDEARPRLELMASPELLIELKEQIGRASARVLQQYGGAPRPGGGEVSSHEVAANRPVYSLAYVASQSVATDAEVKAHVLERIGSDVQSRGVTYESMRLAEMFGLQLPQPNLQQLSPAQIQRLVAEQAKMPDVLRELALALERGGRKEDALRLISRALELRPTGPGIQMIHTRLLAGDESNESGAAGGILGEISGQETMPPGDGTKGTVKEQA